MCVYMRVLVYVPFSMFCPFRDSLHLREKRTRACQCSKAQKDLARTHDYRGQDPCKPPKHRIPIHVLKTRFVIRSTCEVSSFSKDSESMKRLSV